MIEYKKLIDHYMVMERLKKSGGLRKELTPEKCVQMYIQHYNPDINILQSLEIANKIKLLVKEIHNIPW